MSASPPVSTIPPRIERPPHHIIPDDEQRRSYPVRTSPPIPRIASAHAIEEHEPYKVHLSHEVSHAHRQRSSPPQRISTSQLRLPPDAITTTGQENVPNHRISSKAIDHPAAARPISYPLGPAHSVTTSASPPEIQRHRYDPSVYDQPRSVADIRPFPIQVEQRGNADQVLQNRTAPTPPTTHASLNNGKRSYIVRGADFFLPCTLSGANNQQVNGAPYERVGVLGKGGSSKVYSVICPTKRIIYALKRVTLERADAETYQSYTNEIELLKRLRGHDRVIQLIDHQITFGQGNRPKILMVVSDQLLA